MPFDLCSLGSCTQVTGQSSCWCLLLRRGRCTCQAHQGAGSAQAAAAPPLAPANVFCVHILHTSPLAQAAVSSGMGLLLLPSPASTDLRERSVSGGDEKGHVRALAASLQAVRHLSPARHGPMVQVCASRAAHASGPQLSSLLRGCALLSGEPLPLKASAPLAQILNALVPRLPQCSGPSAVEVAWALACLHPSGASTTTATNTSPPANKHTTTRDIGNSSSAVTATVAAAPDFDGSANVNSSSSSSSSLRRGEGSTAARARVCITPPGWWAAYEAHMTERLVSGELPPRALAELLWSVGALGHRPGRAWMEAFAVAAAAALPDFGADDLARLVWAMAAVREEAPAGAWMDRFFTVTSVHLADASFSAHHLALIAGGLAVLRARPRAEWLARFADQVLASLHEARGVHLAKILSSLASLAYTPDEAFMQRFMAAAATRATDLSPAAAAELAWAVARCDRSLSRAHVRALAARLASVGLHSAAAVAASAPTTATAGGAAGVGGNFAILGGAPGLPGTGRIQRDSLFGSGSGSSSSSVEIGDRRSTSSGSSSNNSAMLPSARTRSPSPSVPQSVSMATASFPRAATPTHSSQAQHSLPAARPVRICVDRLPVCVLHGKRVLRCSSKMAGRALLQARKNQHHASSSNSSSSRRANRSSSRRSSNRRHAISSRGSSSSSDSRSSNRRHAMSSSSNSSNRCSGSSTAGEAADQSDLARGVGPALWVQQPLKADTGADPTMRPLSKGDWTPPVGQHRPAAVARCSTEEDVAVRSAIAARSHGPSLPDKNLQEEISRAASAALIMNP
ncbi:hypothetical protein DUNSADRAFT_1818 [Dunaliella salina]|uniref:Uncharacterized protein n=1 Tax=Dunaliella salina TaxID=3046 RepID=A0ABQ7FX13_DUNSA|nr:hypothetical protein DUNSADRAFT_1818 [Dunaliella salina]|eukprot:KAF5826885.1 hypothetical protein DUNSADRAFT_1818 [Dunaliella salina]